MRREGIEGNRQAELEWVLKNRLKFRQIIEEHPELKGIYLQDQEAGINLAKELMDKTDGPYDENLSKELIN